MSNYTSVLTMLLRMRQACDHPSLVASSLQTDIDAIDSRPSAQAEEEATELADMFGGLGVGGEAKCDICFTVLQDRTMKNCDGCAELGRKARAVSSDKVVGGVSHPPSSTKIRKMMSLLREIKENSMGQEKTIVFSQVRGCLGSMTWGISLERTESIFRLSSLLPS